PPAVLPQQMRRHPLLHRASDPHPGMPQPDLGRPFRVAGDAGGDGEGTEGGWGAFEGAHRGRAAYQGAEGGATGRGSRARVCSRSAFTPSAMARASCSRYSGRASFLLSSGWEMNPNSTSTAGASTPVSTKNGACCTPWSDPPEAATSRGWMV